MTWVTCTSHDLSHAGQKGTMLLNCFCSLSNRVRSLASLHLLTLTAWQLYFVGCRQTVFCSHQAVQWCEEYEAHSLHSLFVCCRVEDLTHPEEIRQSAKCDHTVALYGYVRGIPLLPNSPFHMPGCGDFHIHDLSMLPDPCPLPDKQKRRSLNEKEKMIYAPMSGMGGIVYDKDAMYIDLGSSHHGVRWGRGASLINMCVYMHTCTHTQAHTHVYTHLHTHTHTRVSFHCSFLEIEPHTTN